MAFDGFVLKSISQELNSCLINGKIQKVYEPNKDEILLSIYSNGIQYALCINVSSNLYSVHLTNSKKVNPLAAPDFCMLLRKHLMNYRITNISTTGLERILTIELSGYNEEHEISNKKLIIELMGKHSNLLLLNSDDIIIDCLKHFSIENGSNRDILPRCKYIIPASNKLDISEFSLFEYDFDTNMTLSEFFISHFTGISKTLIKHTLNVLGVEDKLNTENYLGVSEYLLTLKNNISIEKTKCILVENDYTLSNCTDKEHLEINFFLDDYYSNKEEIKQFTTYRNQLSNFILAKLKKISKKLSTIDEKLKECSHMEEYKLYGELITSYLYQISREHVSSIQLANYYDNNNLIDIPLDIQFSPADNAKKYFKKYHKLKNTFSIVQEQKLELEKEINYLESIVYEIQAANTIKDLDDIYDEIQESFIRNNKNVSKKTSKKAKVKKSNQSSSPITYNIEDFKILVGRNNKQNDELTFKIANKEDMWFHVKDIQGSHVILITDGKNPSQEIINKCASIAASHSKASQSSNVPVDYTLVKYIKKPSKAKPGMIIYTNNKTVNVQPKA